MAWLLRLCTVCLLCVLCMCVYDLFGWICICAIVCRFPLRLMLKHLNYASALVCFPPCVSVCASVSVCVPMLCGIHYAPGLSRNTEAGLAAKPETYQMCVCASLSGKFMQRQPRELSCGNLLFSIRFPLKIIMKLTGGGTFSLSNKGGGKLPCECASLCICTSLYVCVYALLLLSHRSEINWHHSLTFSEVFLMLSHPHLSLKKKKIGTGKARRQ